MIDISTKQKRQTFLTFYDVSKAYDNVNNSDMLTIMWDKGLRGKAWRPAVVHAPAATRMLHVQQNMTARSSATKRSIAIIVL